MKFAKFASALSKLPPNQQRSSALRSHLASTHARPPTTVTFAAQVNHGLNINNFQDEQEVTVNRMPLWHGVLLFDNRTINKLSTWCISEETDTSVPQPNKSVNKKKTAGWKRYKCCITVLDQHTVNYAMIAEHHNSICLTNNQWQLNWLIHSWICYNCVITDWI